MRKLVIPVAALIMAASASLARAAVDIEVNKDIQQMTVSVDGQVLYRWPVSSGNPTHETPNGKFQTFRMEENHFSKEFDDAPMPHSIFFTRQGHAIHGTDSVKNLGTPVSHGCVRLSRANATTLWNLVKKEGLLKTSVRLTGSSRVALARNPRNVASRGGTLDADASAGQPLDTTPQRVPSGAMYDRPGDDSYQQQPQRQPYYNYGNNSGYGGGISAPDPRDPTRRIYIDPRYSRGYDNNYAQDDGSRYYQRRVYRARPLFGNDDDD
ncbi:L,D-transpeptidase [[Pseudomonas] carboxydohydrogena]|uniref:L,D-transpeptidase n=1 Tax=Afipia carboxydohydrogena TaxID=290 RepID=A0ABY8BR71_AFICR|nr:L,D-transpeptidase [[Pseudomonas] carboxydohydrogena]WEF52495.1 L,D-transpeptidase [[Pseudomonas] carboxydohydrogena]